MTAPAFPPDDPRILKLAQLLHGADPVLVDAHNPTPGERLGPYGRCAIPGDLVATIDTAGDRVTWLIDRHGGALKLSERRARVAA